MNPTLTETGEGSPHGPSSASGGDKKNGSRIQRVFESTSTGWKGPATEGGVGDRIGEPLPFGVRGRPQSSCVGDVTSDVGDVMGRPARYRDDRAG